MRLGLLGPAEGELGALALTAQVLLNGARVDRAVYLGDDDALEEAVLRWAESLVGGDPSDDAAWLRALEVAAAGSPPEIDEFVRLENARRRLRALESLPPGSLRSLEMFGDRVCVLIHDKALLDEEDIFSAQLLVYGRSDAPFCKKFGTRWFLTPGRVGPEGGGVVLDDRDDDIVATFYAADGRVTRSEALGVTRTAKLRILGEP